MSGRGQSSRGRGDGGRGRGDRGRGGGERGRGDFRGGRGRGGGGTGGDEAQVFSYPNEAAPAPNREVTAAEDAMIANVDLSRMSLTDKLAARPGYGTQGKPVRLWANYVQIMPNPQATIHRYDINVTPEAAGKKKQRIIELLIREALASYSTCLASDFRSNLLSSKELQAQDLDHVVTHRMEGEDRDDNQAAASRQYRVRLQPTGTLPLADLISHITSTNASQALQQKDDIIQALNIIVGHHSKAKPASEVMSVGTNRHYALGSTPMDLGGGLQAWRGYFVSVRSAAERLLLNVQVKHAAAYHSGPLSGLMTRFAEENGRNVRVLAKFLRLVRVEVTHLPERNNREGQRVPRVKTIIGLAKPSDGKGALHPPRVGSDGATPERVEFWKEAGEEEQPPAAGKKAGKKGGKQPSGTSSAGGKYVSVRDHFKQTYNIDCGQFPVVNVGSPDKPSYLPAEVCRVVPGQPANAKLSPNQTAKMIKFAVRRPFENARSITNNGLQTIGLDPLNETLKQFVTMVNARLITVPGRVLDSPPVLYKENRVAQTKFGGWNMMRIQFCQGKSLSNWGVLWLWGDNLPDPWEDEGKLQQTLQHFQESLRTSGVEAANPSLPTIQVYITRNSRANLDQGFKTALQRKIGFLLVILPNTDQEIYKNIKALGDQTYGIHTVCVVGQKFGKERGFDQYAANVALKINLKLGGVNQMLSPSKLGIISEGKTMVVGIDVTHPSPGASKDAKSVAGMVASINRDVGQFPAILRIQTGRQEEVSELQLMLETRLDLWFKRNRTLPENILVYRDGVSEGQYDMVLLKEIPELRKACQNRYPANATKANKPRFTVVVVGKRHNTRFYPTDPNDMDTRSYNPQNGTVVDRGVTEPRHWDFYLQAHTALQGTARSAHYFVVHDEIFNKKPFPPGFANGQEVLESLTHNMSYLFARATKAVSVIPPAYYADLVCERARCYVSEAIDDAVSQVSGQTTSSVSVGALDIHERLKDTMFYI